MVSPLPDRGRVRSRWAPSPTGNLHLGNARTALVAWLSVRLQRGAFVWRVEDLDQPRTVSGLAEQQIEEMRWLGLDWDEGPGSPNDSASSHSFYQSERDQLYLSALRQLNSRNHLFPCKRSRREIQQITSAPHGHESSPYPASLRPGALSGGWFERTLSSQPGDRHATSIRFRVEPGEVVFHDLMVGEVRERVDQRVGDFVVRRRDGAWAYQLAVVVDDIEMSITEVVRGADLLDSTARQLLLFESLGATPPDFAHVPLMLNHQGSKLSKRDQATHLSSLREQGVQADRVIGYLAESLRLTESGRAITACELLELVRSRCADPAAFWDGLHPETIVLSDDILSLLEHRGSSR